MSVKTRISFDLVVVKITMMAVIAIIFLLISAVQQGNCKEICRTKSCIETATRVLNAMNKTIEPCQDFFEFACRGWITKNPIPSGTTSWDRMGIMVDDVIINIHRILESPDIGNDERPMKLARAMYRTCMDTESVENLGPKPLYDTFEKIGFPLKPPIDEEAKNFDISKIVGKADRYNQIKMFINTFITQNIMDYTKNNLMMEQTSPFSKGFEIYLRDPVHFKTIIDAQKDYIKGMMKLAGVGKKSEEYTIEFVEFMTKIAKIMATAEDKLQPDYVNHAVTIDELQKLTNPHPNHWNWTTYMENFFENSDITIDPKNDIVVVIDLDYVKRMISLLEETPKGTIARFGWLTVLLEVAPKTTEEYRDLEFEFRKIAYGLKSKPVLWFTCTKTAMTYFDMALTAAYVKKHFSVEEKEKAIEMWKDVSTAFNEMLTEIQWMDTKTKEEARKKLLTMRPFMGFPEWVTNSTKLAKYYEDFEVSDGKLFDTYLRFNLIEGKRKLNSWREAPDRNRWLTSALSIGAWYSPVLNSITVPAGMLHTPLYGNAVEAINYGAIGAIMGHELTHGFDNTGRNYDNKGNYRQWWSAKTLKHYLAKVQCMIQQYSGFTVTQLGENYKLNGVITQGENIADNGGLTEAFRAYKKLKERNNPQPGLPGLDDYTDEQLFFLGFAQMWCGSETDEALKAWVSQEVHAPNRYRVLGTLQNSVDFAETWKCSSVSPMNPTGKCVVW